MGGFGARDVGSIRRVVEFLSDAWLARFDAAVRVADDLVADPPFAIATLVRIGDRDCGYRVRFGSHGAWVGRPGTAPADVVFVTDAATAWELHRGELRAQDAFARGTLKVRGRPEVLAARPDILAALERAVAPLRAETTFGRAR
jgi:hypothetical protein